MPIFVYTLHLRENAEKVGLRKASQKERLEDVMQEFREKGARILNIRSNIARIGTPLKTVNQVTITYEAPEPIEFKEKKQP